jgi:hypothetical protein
MRALLCCWLAVGVLTGCGLRHRVDRDLVETIPPEDKLALFDAENDVLIAKDEREAALTDKEDAERSVEDAERDVSSIRKRADAERDPRLKKLLSVWADRKIEWREAEVDLCKARRDAADEVLMAARARYERTKAQIVKERVPRKATDIDLKDFTEQVKDRESDAADARKDVDKARAERDKKRAAYDVTSRQLQQLSGGAYGGPWAD